MNEEVRKALDRVQIMCDTESEWADIGITDWQIIRAELTRLTEIADSVDPLVIRLGEVTTRLEAANALLRKCRDEFARLPHSLGYDFTHLPEIDAHLSENGHD